MSADNLITLYSDKLLALAASAPLTVPLDAPDAEVKRRAPLCGSHIVVSIQMSDGQISAFHQDVKACALGQAAASVFARHAVGLDREMLVKIRDEMRQMLAENAPAPDGIFSDLKYLEAARDFKNRHESIMLVFEATLDAMDQAQKKASA